MVDGLSDAAFTNAMVCCSVNVLTFLAGFLSLFLKTLPESACLSLVADRVYLVVSTW